MQIRSPRTVAACLLSLAVLALAAEPALRAQTLLADAPSTLLAANASSSNAPSSITPAADAHADPAVVRIVAVVQPRPVVMVNGRPYLQPTPREQFDNYLRDSYLAPAMARSSISALISQGKGIPTGWGQDAPGFGQRFGSAAAVTAINGNVRYALSSAFHEDLRYVPCHGCRPRRKFANAFLAEVTARHDSDGHRHFTLTPIVADFSGPLVANSFWFPPGNGPLDGLVATRMVVATRVGGHLFREFVLEYMHYDPRIN